MEYVSVNEKVSTWIRTTYQVNNVNSYEEALKKVINIYDSGECVFPSDDIFPFDKEEIYECEEYLEPEDNGGEATIEILNASGNIVWDNKK